MTTNKEVYHEGWLVKSPPTKRIWRARWRRRWFTLKQGELPGQFFLEYYTDRKCRKLKGIIDLDQCEQVDAGLRLDRQKEKYAHMFDVKTPTRTYYLAADTEEDMRGWVNCICQVCNLQETQTEDDRPYYNVGAINMADAMNMAEQTQQANHYSTSVNNSSLEQQQDLSNDTQITLLNNSTLADVSQDQMQQQLHQQQQQQQHLTQQQPQPRHSLLSSSYNPYGTYQNEEVMNFRGSEYTNRETIICETKLNQTQAAGARIAQAEAYSNLGTIERSQSLRGKPNSPEKGTPARPGGTLANHMRTQSLNTDHKLGGGGGKKIPENLKLNERPFGGAGLGGAGTLSSTEQPSPSLSNSSGAYIPISECFSGSPMLLHSPITPLNSLDPRFYDTPRSHTNIGFNLTNNEQPYSPKRNNFGVAAAAAATASAGGTSPAAQTTGQQVAADATLALASVGSKTSRSGKSSPSDSESVFTDDEWTLPAGASAEAGLAGGTKDRNTRPSDSSIENDAIGWTYVQRFSKVPTEEQQSKQPPAVASPPPRPPKRTSLILESIEKHKEIQSSDTENASPAIGPKDASSVVEQYYDIPRSHQPGQYGGSSMMQLGSEGDLLSPLSQCDLVASSTPNLMTDTVSQAGTLSRSRPHCYSNAAPQLTEGNVFRFDFSEQGPAINRNLKPKSNHDITKSVESIAHSMKQVSLGAMAKNVPPSVDRTRKPVTPKIGTNSMRRKGGPMSLNLQNNNQENVYGNTQEQHAGQLFSGISPRTPGKTDDRLQYLDLDHSNSPQKPHISSVNHYGGGTGGPSGAGPLGSAGAGGTGSGISNSALNGSVAGNVGGTPYTTVDFVKTDAFNRIRADSEKNRNQSALKDQM